MEGRTFALTYLEQRGDLLLTGCGTTVHRIRQSQERGGLRPVMVERRSFCAGEEVPEGLELVIRDDLSGRDGRSMGVFEFSHFLRYRKSYCRRGDAGAFTPWT